MNGLGAASRVIVDGWKGNVAGKGKSNGRGRDEISFDF